MKVGCRDTQVKDPLKGEHEDKHGHDGIDECQDKKGLMGLREKIVGLCILAEV
jgi:hypothetical protein